MRSIPDRILPLLAGLALVSPSSCADPGPRFGGAGLPSTDHRLAVRVDPVYRLGVATAGEDWQQFERVRDLAFDDRGLLHLFDQGAEAVRVVGRDGRLVRSVGRRGEGPGELSAPVGMAVAPDGRIAIWDLGRRSAALFGPEGRYLRNAALDRSRAVASPRFLDSAGNAYGIAQLGWSGRAGSPELTPWIRTADGMLEAPPGVPILRLPLDGAPAEVLAWTWFPAREAVDGAPAETAFLPRVHWGLLPDGRVVFADSLDYRIVVVGSDRPAALARDLPPPPVRRAHRDAEIERRLRSPGESPSRGAAGFGAAGFGADPGEADRARERRRRAQLEAELRFPESHQVVQGLRVDADGRLWVERVGEDPFRPGPIDLLEPDGAYVGTIAEGELALPDALGPGGLAAWLEHDELGVPLVRVGRVRIAHAEATGAAPADPAAPVELALRSYAGRLRQIDVGLGLGAGPDDSTHSFLFDTGGGLTLIDPELTDAAGCEPHGRITGYRMSGEAVEFRPCGEARLRLGPLTEDRYVAVFDLMALLPEGLPPLWGVISLHTLQDRAFTLDLAANRLTIETEESLAARAAGMDEVTLHLERDMEGRGLSAYLEVEAERGTLRLLVDSGNLAGVILAPHALEQLGVDPAVARPDTVLDLRIAGLGVVRTPVLVQEIRHDGAVGAEFLEGLVFTADLRSGRAWARRRE